MQQNYKNLEYFYYFFFAQFSNTQKSALSSLVIHLHSRSFIRVAHLYNFSALNSFLHFHFIKPNAISATFLTLLPVKCLDLSDLDIWKECPKRVAVRRQGAWVTPHRLGGVAGTAAPYVGS